MIFMTSVTFSMGFFSVCFCPVLCVGCLRLFSMRGVHRFVVRLFSVCNVCLFCMLRMRFCRVHFRSMRIVAFCLVTASIEPNHHHDQTHQGERHSEEFSLFSKYKHRSRHLKLGSGLRRSSRCGLIFTKFHHILDDFPTLFIGQLGCV